MTEYTKYGDGGDSGQTGGQATRGQRIEIKSLSTGDIIHFKAFLTSFSDSYTSSYDSEEIYGRMDPIQTFKQTARKIKIDFDIPAGSESEAANNMNKIASLTRSLYPVYGGDGAQTLKAPPLFKIKFMNLVQDAATGEGLIVTLEGFDFNPDVAQGFFINSNSMMPKLLKASLSMTVLHTHKLGSDSTGKARDPNAKQFPYEKSFSPGVTFNKAKSKVPDSSPKLPVRKKGGSNVTGTGRKP